ncbi:MAG: type I DNA topoisomerase [Candidatus Magasanikbacteria bacterium]|jgi:DNA topoisomerase-1
MSKLVIVESPTKAKTITKFLGKGFVVKSSFGHVRDLPKSKMGVDTKNDFEPQYVVSKEKAAVAKELKDSAKKCDEVLFATDEDREGEAISWHLAEILNIDPSKIKRIVFHEITKHAIDEAMKHPRPLDLQLVDAQQARRILDRLVGYELSPFLWRKVAKGLSAGRVQSVAVRLVVEREREIQKFISEEYWSVDGIFEKEQGVKNKEQFTAKLHAIAGKKLDKLDLKNKEQVDKILADLEKTKYTVTAVDSKNTKRFPSPPFTTSSLQQDANNRLGFSAKQTMRMAQQLYEGIELGSEGQVGLITYMRTDSVNLSEKFLAEASDTIKKEFGDKYALATARTYKSKSKNAQEAHEAVRPTEASRTPDDVAPFLEKNQLRLYDLIWRRAMATQMSPAELNATTIEIESANKYSFRASGQTIVFDGFLKLYPDKSKENLLPVLKAGAAVDCAELKPEQHFTEPPARYNDASLVKALEEYGIGRPSTYAPTIATIEDRGYVERNDQKRLAPKEIAFMVNDLLVAHFPQIVDLDFTAQMEESFDKVARGEEKWKTLIADFYGPFKANLKAKDKEIDKKELTEEKSDEICDKCQAPMIIKMGRYGKFLACSAYPECKNIKSMPGSDRDKNGQADSEQIIALKAKYAGKKCEKCDSDMAIKVGKFGPFLACTAYPKCKNIVGIAEQNPSTGVKCPTCKEGDIVMKRSRRGPFYACNRYPDCKTILAGKPTGENCPTCQHPLVEYGKQSKIKCSNKECDYTK